MIRIDEEKNTLLFKHYKNKELTKEIVMKTVDMMYCVTKHMRLHPNSQKSFDFIDYIKTENDDEMSILYANCRVFTYKNFKEVDDDFQFYENFDLEEKIGKIVDIVRRKNLKNKNQEDK